MTSEQPVYVCRTPPTAEQRLEQANRYLTWFSHEFLQDTVNPEEDAWCVYYVITEYARRTAQVLAREKITEIDYYRYRNAATLCAVLISEFHEDGTLDEGWIYDQDGNEDNIRYLTGDLLVSALYTLQEALTNGRRQKNFDPLSEEEIETIAGLI